MTTTMMQWKIGCTRNTIYEMKRKDKSKRSKKDENESAVYSRTTLSHIISLNVWEWRRYLSFFYPHSKSRFLPSRFISTFVFCVLVSAFVIRIFFSPKSALRLHMMHDQDFYQFAAAKLAWVFFFLASSNALSRTHNNILCECLWYYHSFTLKIGYNELCALCALLHCNFCCWK